MERTEAQSPAVAVERALEPVADALRREGYRVLPLESPLSASVQAVVVTGADIDLLGSLDIQTRSPVIAAAGKSPQEILEEVRRAVNLRGEQSPR